MTAPHRPATAIAVAVVRVGSHVLVGRRSELAREGPGLDEFPGGKVEAGESLEEAATRECLEETGLEVTVVRRLDVAAGMASFGPIEVTFFLAEPAKPSVDDVLPDVRAPFAWRGIDTIAGLSFPKTNRRVVAMLAGGQGGS